MILSMPAMLARVTLPSPRGNPPTSSPVGDPIPYGRRRMLKGLDPLLTPELLHVLAAMGHGDELVLVDRNYPSVSTAQRLVRIDGADLPQAARAILSLLPLDTFIDEPVAAMAVVGAPDEVPEVQQEIFDLARDAEGREVGVERVERFAFYERARQAFAVVATSESRPYGCVTFVKGVIT